MDSKTYWAKREAEQLKHNITEEAEYEREIQRIYSNMLDACNKEINAFYGKYATAEGITLAEAKKRVSILDIKEYERKAKRYVKDKDFSAKANEEMRLYNATMKINRLEMLKANIGLEMITGHSELEKFMGGILKGRTIAELERQAGILGKTVRNNAKAAHAIVNGSFHSGTFSDRIWQYQDLMREDLGKLLQTGLIRGKNPRAIAGDLKKYWYGNDPKTGGGAEYCMERLMRTELARVQTEAQKQSFERNGFDKYIFIVNAGCCGHCEEVADKDIGFGKGVYLVKDMQPGLNAPPLHPHDRCSTAAYSDRKEYEEWLDFLEKGGTTEEYNRQKAAGLLTKNSKNSTISSKFGFNLIKGKHTREADLAATNPKYSTGREYKVNCQRCVSAYEARRRGYDVEALPAITNGVDRMPYMFDKKEGWTSVYDGIKPINCTSNRTAGVKKKVEETMLSFGDGARAIVRVQWQQKYGGGGHVFIAEQVDGKTIFIDPQNNKQDVSGYFQLAKTKETYVLRIDDLEFTDNIKKCCKNIE